MSIKGIPGGTPDGGTNNLQTFLPIKDDTIYFASMDKFGNWIIERDVVISGFSTKLMCHGNILAGDSFEDIWDIRNSFEYAYPDGHTP